MSLRMLAPAHWAVTLAMLAGAIAMTIWYAPMHAEMGGIQKIFYFHLSVAINTFLACGAVFVAAVAFLWHRDQKWDAIGDAGGRVAVLLCVVVLLTGMIWAKNAWGHWWEWSPPLTFTLVLLLLYVGYVLIRKLVRSPERRATISAVYAIVAFLDVPLVYLSVKLLPDQHPAGFPSDPATRYTLLMWMVTIAMLTGGLIGARYRVTQRCGGTLASGRPSDRDRPAPEGSEA